MGRRNFIALSLVSIVSILLASLTAITFFYGEARDLFGTLLRSTPFFVLLVALLFTLVILVSSFLTRNIASSINKIDFDAPDDTFDELGEFFQKVLRRDRQIESQISDLRIHSQTMGALIENMQDGFVMVDPTGKVITANPRAIALFGARQKPEGKNIIHLLADSAFLENVDAALAGEGGQMTLTKTEKAVQVSFLPSANKGAIILAADITEKQQAEIMRREFSANVSHELKTPLTSIAGFAELLSAGMVSEGDVPGIAGKIEVEAKRMINLIENILMISKLDEREGRESFLPNDIAEIACEAASGLSQMAEKHEIALILLLKPCFIKCNKLLIYEMFMNLIGNAIQYNTPGGKVDVSVENEGNGRCKITIADTGIGIPKTEQPKIFERFYRVEQSRGRKTGGAGLGLSIVKHVVKYHGGEIQLMSEENKGTTVTVSLN